MATHNPRRPPVPGDRCFLLWGYTGGFFHVDVQAVDLNSDMPTITGKVVVMAGIPEGELSIDTVGTFDYDSNVRVLQ